MKSREIDRVVSMNEILISGNNILLGAMTETHYNTNAFTVWPFIDCITAQYLLLWTTDKVIHVTASDYI